MIKNKNIKIKGLSDQNIADENENSLISDMYYDALEKYIMTCNTPMTIAIQGEWGSGKSSFMKCIEDRIKNKVFYLSIDVWPFSLFNLGDNLSIAILNYIYGKIDEDETFVKEILKKMAKIGSSYLSNKFLDNDATDIIFNNSEIDQINNLKKKFQEAIEKVTEDKNRAVIFIDNLDRIEPKRAFEIIEVLKIFFECEKCVFVLAVDYDVIKEGAKEKYNKEKCEVYFDKIIQLPFNMPVDTYDVDKYLEKLLINAFNHKLDNIKNELADIIKITIGNNPRAIKRIINAFTITCYIDVKGMNNKDKESDNARILLFLLLCIQLASIDLYYYLVEKSEIINDDSIDAYLNQCVAKKIPPEIINNKKLFKNNLDDILYKYGEIVNKVGEELKDKGVVYNIISKVHLTLSKSYLMTE